ncbi:MAG: hypothetical protein K2X27_03090 [Candidatus Obscuribacterales bacterium]|nr:hypothetical protein [Candidatus Obscuribacterales bacterium]
MSENEEKPEASSTPEAPPVPPKKETAAASESGFQRLVKKIDPAIAKTVMDMEAVRLVLNKPRVSVEEKLEELKFRPAEAAKAILPFDDYRNASPCSAKWESMSGPEKSKVCGSCLLNVYDFDSMDIEQVKDAVLKREGKIYTRLYKRKDGRFLSRDCPVGVKKKQDQIAAICGVVLLLVAAIAALILYPPQLKYDEPSPQPLAGKTVVTESSSNNSASTASSTSTASEIAATGGAESSASTESTYTTPQFYPVPKRKNSR